MRNYNRIVFSSVSVIVSRSLWKKGGLSAVLFIVPALLSAQHIPLDSALHIRAPLDSVFTLDFCNRLNHIDGRDLRQWAAAVSADSFEGRASGTEGLRKSALWLQRRLREIGFDSAAVLQSFPVFHEQLTGRIHIGRNQTDSLVSYNVVAVKKGQGPLSEESVVVTAHLDHLGKDGKVVYPGANDNASGIAVMLAIAEAMSGMRLDRTVVLIAFSGEEAGLLGSKYFLEHPLIDLGRVAVLINLDLVGSGRNGIMVQGGQDYPLHERAIMDINRRLFGFELSTRPNSPNSDQYYFNRAGVPAFFFYAYNGTVPYHSPNDTADRLDPGVLENVAKFVWACVWNFGRSR